MLSAKRLATLRKLSQLKLLKQQLLLAEAQNRTQSSKQQLFELQKYEQDYLQHAENRQQGPALPSWQLVNQRRFLDQIDAGIQLQNQTIAQDEERQKEAMAYWQSAHQYDQKLGELSENAERSERIAEDKAQERRDEDAFLQAKLYQRRQSHDQNTIKD